jgi:hypothetical protein
MDTKRIGFVEMSESFNRVCIEDCVGDEDSEGSLHYRNVFIDANEVIGIRDWLNQYIAEKGLS